MIPPKKLPFSTSTVSPEKSKNEIVKLLKSFGINDYAWSEDGGMIQLAFKTETEYEGEMKIWNVIIRPPILVETMTVYDEKQRMKVKKDIPNYVQSLRILLNHLKTKLTVVACGLTKFEEEFMAGSSSLTGRTRSTSVSGASTSTHSITETGNAYNAEQASEKETNQD